MRKINAVIFDLDGTLVYFKIDYMAARREIISKLYTFGIPQNLVSIEQRILTTVKIAENYLKTIKMAPEKITKLKKQINQIISKYEMEGAKKTNLIPGAEKLLRTLKNRGFKLGLFTLEDRNTTNFLLEKCSINSFFDSIVTRDDVNNFKPDPEHLKAVLAQLNVSSHEIIIVGDNPIDIECAKGINALAIARLSERHTKDELSRAGADFIVDNLLEINKILENI